MSTLVRVGNADDDQRVDFPAMLKSQIMILRKELGEHAPAGTAPHSPIAQSQSQAEKGPDEQVSPVQQPSTASQEEQRSRHPVQLALPIVVPAADIPDNSYSVPMVQAVRKSGIGTGRYTLPRVTSKASGTGSTVHPSTLHPQGRVLPAPPSAYPQVMPGSLPSTGGADITQGAPARTTTR